ncbi:hypothetical protein SAMN05661080_01474 [Modestobacter sp. DSM 44400]|nr:hypothetical protein SAMN05661080_01474 [Modestobacter sp. DSM 44400]
MADRRYWWKPRYELWLVGDDTNRCICVWTRHRFRTLAAHSRRLEEEHLRVSPARLVIMDRHSGREVGGRG